ncbi:MAG: PAS domain-containing sensor histidine kinase [Armatimonadota bacterium]|nr:PAS domain-containing sensor histidine kinase [Armatimonadota bacterium]
MCESDNSLNVKESGAPASATPCSESEQLYRLLAENVTDVIWTTDLNLQLTYCSPSVYGLRGYTAEETMGQTIDEIMTPDSIAVALEALREALALEDRGRPDQSDHLTLELEHTCKDGSTVWAETSVRLLRDAARDMAGLVGVTRDISERKRADDALRQSEARYRSIFDAIADGICVLSPDGIILDANTAMCDMLRWPLECMLGKYIRDIVDERFVSDADEFFSRVKRSGEVHYEVITALDDGSVIASDVHARHHSYQDKPAILVVVRDVTERKQALDELRKRADRLQAQHARLKAATVQKASFFASMSHELRTPMTSIIGFTELLLDDLEDPVSAGQRELLLKVSQNGRRLLGMVNDLLDLSRLESRRMTPVVSEVDLGLLMEQIVANMRPLAKDKDLEIVVTNGGPTTNVYTDEQKLSQILVNLISNAIKFTPSGRVTVAAEATGSQIQVSVSDTGLGIPRSEHRKIFDEFHTMAQRGRQKMPGTGLGLAITKKLCDLLGGKINVVSEPGKGSTFTVLLPNSRPEG